MRKIKIFDTTLRDGEQTPGATMTVDEKVRIAKSLDLLNVDVIEAGFAASSKGDFEAVEKIAQAVEKATVCSLSRAIEKDIELAGRALEKAKNRRIHTFIATSDIHMEYKLKMSKDEVIKRAIKAVEIAKSFVDDVQFSFEDATRSNFEFMRDISEAIIEAGAKTINIPDTVGVTTPKEIREMISYLKNVVGERAVLSVHNHNDLGLATANSLEGILSGANQVECTINGLGERAGNASLEEIVMAIHLKDEIYKDIYTDINLKDIYPTSRLLSYITGIEPQPNKAIVGKNAFAHESGIHQDGFLKNKLTYQIIDPLDIGKIDNDAIVLGKLSGRAAFITKVKELGFEVGEDDINIYFEKFKALADYKKNIYDEDIIAIVSSENSLNKVIFKDINFQDNKIFITVDGKEKNIDIDLSSGIINSLFKSIDKILETKGILLDYSIKAVTMGKDSMANAGVTVSYEDKKYSGHSLNIDTIHASCEAYISALNKYLSDKSK